MPTRRLQDLVEELTELIYSNLWFSVRDIRLTADFAYLQFTHNQPDIVREFSSIGCWPDYLIHINADGATFYYPDSAHDGWYNDVTDESIDAIAKDPLCKELTHDEIYHMLYISHIPWRFQNNLMESVSKLVKASGRKFSLHKYLHEYETLEIQDEKIFIEDI